MGSIESYKFLKQRTFTGWNQKDAAEETAREIQSIRWTQATDAGFAGEVGQSRENVAWPLNFKQEPHLPPSQPTTSKE